MARKMAVTLTETRRRVMWVEVYDDYTPDEMIATIKREPWEFAGHYIETDTGWCDVERARDRYDIADLRSAVRWESTQSKRSAAAVLGVALQMGTGSYLAMFGAERIGHALAGLGIE